MPKYTVSTRYGTVEVEADSQPSTADVEEYLASQRNGAVQKAKNTAEVNASEPSITDMVMGMGIEGLTSTAGAVGGGALGMILGAPAGPAGSAALGFKMGAAGGAIGGALGSYLRQLFEQGKGQRDEISGGQIVASGMIGAIPGAFGARVVSGAANIAKPMVFRAVQGGVTAVAGEVIEKAIDENRLPTWDEIKVPLAFGAATGGALGAVERRYITNGNLISNPIAAQAVQAGTGLGVGAYVYNTEKEKGNENAFPVAVAYGLATYGGTHIPSLIAKDKEKFANQLKRGVAGPESVVGDPVVNANYELKSRIKGSQNDAADFNRLISDIINRSPDPAQERANLLSVFDGRAPRTILSQDMQKVMGRMDKIVGDNAVNIVALYPNMSDELRKGIIDNGADYKRNGYMAFNSKAQRGRDWDTEATRNAFMSELADGFESEALAKKAPITRAQAEAYADNYMKQMVKDTMLITSGGIIDPSMIGGLTSPLKKRKDLSKAAENWLGKVDDPGLIAEITLKAQDRLIIQAEYDKQIAQYLLSSGIGTKGDTSGMGDYVLLIGADSPVARSNLAGIKVPRMWADAHNELQNSHLFGDNGVTKALLSFSGFSKAMKTVGNIPEALAPQMFGNAAFAASSGALNPITLFEGLRKTAYDFGWRGGKLDVNTRLKMMDEFKKLRALGVLRGGAEIEELRTLTGSATRNTRYKQWMDEASKLYGFPDTSFRYAIYKQNEKDMLALGPEGIAFLSAKNGLDIPGAGTDQAARVAAILTSDHFPTYEKINRRFRQLSAAGVANAFGSFEYEVVRNFKNMLVHNKRLLELSLTAQSQKTREAAAKQFAKRSLSMAAVAASTAGIAVAGNRMLGTDAQDQEDMQRIAPTYDQYKSNLFKANNDGTFTYAPINYMMPYANMMSTLSEAIKGGNPLPYLKTTFLGDDLGPLFTSVNEAITNTYYGTQVAITEPRDNMRLIERLVTRAFLPQFIVGTLSRTEKALTDKTNKLGTKYTLEDQAMRFAGIRANTMDILGAASVRIRDIAQPMGQELTGYKRILKGSYDETTKQYAGINEENIYNERNIRYMRAQDELAATYRALKRLSDKTNGFDDNKIIDSFRAAGVPNRIIAAAVFGYKVPMPRGMHESHSDIVDAIMSDKEQRPRARQILAGIAGSDRRMLKSLTDTYANYLREEKRGVNNVTRLFSGMSVGDGERANNIILAMGTYASEGNPKVAEAFKRQLTRAGVITPEVEAQIRQKLAGRP